MHKKFQINRTNIKGGCQSGRQVVTHNFKSDLPLMLKDCLSLIVFRHDTIQEPHNSLLFFVCFVGHASSGSTSFHRFMAESPYYRVRQGIGNEPFKLA